MGNELVSRFFNYDDEKINKLDDFIMPTEWWSRPYEYAWTMKFLEAQDTILDAGCGIEHPFKFYASKRVKKCYAVDKDDRINTLHDTDTLEFIQSEFGQLEEHFEPDSMDKIFCISVLEHMYPVNIVNSLMTFKKILKPNGKIILTLDHPLLETTTLMNLVHEAGLCFYGSVDFEIDNARVIKGEYANLKCYRAILCKPEDEQEKPETIEIKPKETKPKKPKETK